MTITATIPLLVSLVGALLYVLSGNAKLSEIGRLSFFAGLLATCLAVAGHAVRIG